MKTISKTIQRSISISKYALLAFLVAFSFSCSTEDGNDGAPGAEGPQGPAGTDGNANVIVKTVVPDPGPYLNWTPGMYLNFFDSNVFEINDTAITQDILDNAIILVYFQLFGVDVWYPMQWVAPHDGGNDETITFDYRLNLLSIYAFKPSGPLYSSISKVKYFIIDSSNNRTQSIDYTEMTYEELVAHFNIKNNSSN